MMSFKRMGVVLVCVTMVLCACGPSKEEKQALKTSEKPPNEALAKVGDRYVTVSEYQQLAKMFPPTYAESEGGRTHIINQVIERILLKKEAESRGLTRNPELLARIEEYALSLYRSNLLHDIKSSQQSVSDKDAASYYDANEATFGQTDKVRISVLEMAPEKETQINAVYKELKAGKDFAQLARMHSKHPSAQNGGDMGYLIRNQYAPLTNIAFGMKPGEISKPFKTPYGWDIIRVTELVKKQEIPPEERIQRARARMEAMQTAQVYQEIIKNLKEKNTVVLYADNIKQLAAATAAPVPAAPAGKTQ